MKTVKIEQTAIMDITELDELKVFLPEIDDIANEKLKNEIIEQGIREPLSLAMIDGKAVLLDGHNRLRLVTTTPELKGYTTVPTTFYDHITDLTNAKQLMVNNQLGKRNLGVAERVLMVLQLEPELAEQAKAFKKMTAEEKEQNSAQPTGRTIEKLAKMAGTSRDTITKIKRIQATGNTELLKIANKSVDKALIIADKIKELPPEEAQAVIEEALAKKPAETETVSDNGIEYTRVTEHSYITKTDDLNFDVVSLEKDENGEFIRFGNDELATSSKIEIRNGEARVTHSPVKIKYFRDIDNNIDRLYALIDNMKLVKKLIEQLKEKQERIKRQKIPKPLTEKQLARAEKKRLEDEAKAQKQADKKAQREERARKEELYRRTPSATQQTQLNDRIYKLVDARTLASRKEDIDKAIYQITQRIYVYKTSADEHRKTAKAIFAEMNIPLAGKAKPAKEPKAPAKAKTKAPAKAKAKKPTAPAEPAPAKFETNIGEALKSVLPAKKKAPAKPAKTATAKPAKKAKQTTDEEVKQRLEEMLLIVKSDDKKAEIIAEIAELDAKINSRKN